MELTICGGEKYAGYTQSASQANHHHPAVTDMLVAVLNTCTKEELEDIDEEATSLAAAAESAERRRAIKSKIMAVGRMSRVFALLRFVHVPIIVLLSVMNYCAPVRNQKEFPSSRAFLEPLVFHMAHLHQERKKSRTRSADFMTRAYFLIKLA